MGIFDFLRKKKPALSQSEKLLENLNQAVSQDNMAEFGKLCRDNIELIENHFEKWKIVPEGLRGDPQQVQQYIMMIVSVADYFYNTLGRRSLREALQGADGDNPIVQWESTIVEARERFSQMDFIGAEEVLRTILAKNENLIGSAVTELLPVNLGLLGQALFHQGKAHEALEYINEANELCANERDLEGVLAYTATLYEINRYMGEFQQAADCANDLADLLRQSGQITEAMQWRRRSELARDGEPLNRVQVQFGDRTYELDEIDQLKLSTLNVQFLFARNRISPALCDAHCRTGVNLGEEGRFEEALEQFKQATLIDVHDPQPHYMRGLTLLNLRRYGEAIEAYETTETLAPGWFQCRSDLWMSKQLAGGRYSHELFDALCQVQDENLSNANKINICQEWLQRHADLASLYLFLGKSLQAAEQDENAYQCFRQGLIVAEEPDVRTRLLVAAASVSPPGPDREWFLESAVEENGNLVSAAMARVLKQVYD